MNLKNFAQFGIRNLRVLDFTLTPQAGFEPQYRRPLHTHLTGEGADALMRGVNVNPTLTDVGLAARDIPVLADGLITLDPVPEAPSEIVGGWHTPRYAFVMTLEFESTYGATYYETVAGYTEHADMVFPHTGAIDPDAHFIINSVTRQQPAVIHSTRGVHRVVELNSHHVHRHPEFRGIRAEDPQRYLLRPEDVVGYMQMLGVAQSSGAVVVDTRQLLTTNAAFTDRSLDDPLRYLATLGDAYLKTRLQTGGLGDMAGDLCSTLFSMLDRSKASDSAFLSVVRNLQDTPLVPTSFTLRQLLASIPALLSAAEIKPAQALASDVEWSSWHGSDASTCLAASLAQILPGYLSAFGLQHAHFSLNNFDNDVSLLRGLAQAPAYTPAPVLSGRATLAERIKRELIRSLTYNELIGYALDVDCSVFGTTTLSLALEDGPVQYYRYPNFADALMSPQLTHHQHRLQSLAQDMSSVFDLLADAIPPSPLSGGII